jgi:GxxExxY protein
MPSHDLKNRELTEKIIGCAMKVHRYFGQGFPEKVYKQALMIELEKNRLIGQARSRKRYYLRW